MSFRTRHEEESHVLLLIELICKRAVSEILPAPVRQVSKTLRYKKTKENNL